MLTTEEFVQRELERSGRSTFTLAEVRDMADRLRAERIAAAPPFLGWIGTTTPADGCMAPTPCPVTSAVQCVELRFGDAPEEAAARPCLCLCHVKAHLR